MRGALGVILRRLVCLPECADPSQCPRTEPCAYTRIFAPGENPGLTGPSGLAQPPRPFVLRASHLDGLVFAAGDSFAFDLILFQHPSLILPHFERVFLDWNRGRLSKVEAIGRAAPQFDLADRSQSATRLLVRFLTPTELKTGGVPVRDPAFSVLFRRLRDRVSNLRAAYQGGPLSLDFSEMGQRAEQVQTLRHTLRILSPERRSSRTGQTHALGGFLGEAEYEGEISPFLPFFYAGEWTGVGRHTVWGNGKFEFERS